MLKIFNKFLFVVLVTMSVSSLKAQDSKMLDVKVSIKTVQIQKIFESDVRIRLETTIKFCNLGDKSLIFLKEEDYPNFPGIVLADSRENLKARNYLTFDYFGEAVNTSEKWNILSTKLDTLKPSTDNFIILKANEITEFEREIVFYLPTEKSVSSYFPKKESWEKIKTLENVWLQVIGSSWSFNLDRARKNLGKKLQKRWSKYGYLWLDDVRSVPILLDLSSAVVKTSEN